MPAESRACAHSQKGTEPGRCGSPEAFSWAVDQATGASDLFDLWPLVAAAALALLTLEWIVAVVPWRRQAAVATATAAAGTGRVRRR